MLSELKRLEADDPAQLVRELLAAWRDGRIKTYVISRALGFRRAHAKLFQEGAYIPLSVSGERKEHVVAFARRTGNAWALVVVPRLVTRLSAPGRPPLGKRVWKGGVLTLPAGAPHRWLDIFTGGSLCSFGAREDRAIHLSDVFRDSPMALLSGTGKPSASSRT
jgi:(1->4)-alpha-D-glucan 1-alpha-D-glucosylmutase